MKNPIWGLPVGPFNLALTAFRWDEMIAVKDALIEAYKRAAATTDGVE